ncbi:MAG TPA: hypothetical protein VLE97_05675 [Gaiellaceae bacterium]|nr:hypothetical protein [Gaiellaceae bacterium]
MAKIWIDWSDGRYYTRLLTDAEAANREALDLDVAHVEDSVWEEYLRHCGQDGIWQALWRSISNEQWMRRREKELMPLEEAAREIARLKDDLARAERLSKHHEERWTGAMRAVRGGDHREREFTCVFPRPGCDVEILPPAWRDRAREILAKYRTDLAAEGMVVQGCCCGHDHQRLHDATVVELRRAGFIVEHDVEYDDEGES